MKASEVKVNQRLQLNLICHRNSDASTPNLQLFKSFATALHSSDQYLSILPVSIAKQDLPSISNKTQINLVDKNRMMIYFKPYFSRQNYSLSGYFYISSSKSIQSSKHCWIYTSDWSVTDTPYELVLAMTMKWFNWVPCVSAANSFAERTSRKQSNSTPLGYFPILHDIQSYISLRANLGAIQKTPKCYLFARKNLANAK